MEISRAGKIETRQVFFRVVPQKFRIPHDQSINQWTNRSYIDRPIGAVNDRLDKRSCVITPTSMSIKRSTICQESTFHFPSEGFTLHEFLVKKKSWIPSGVRQKQKRESMAQENDWRYQNNGWKPRLFILKNKQNKKQLILNSSTFKYSYIPYIHGT